MSALCFTLELYPGAPFGVDWAMIGDPALFLTASAFLIIPAGLFALFAVWPFVLLVTQVMFRLEPTIPPAMNWAFWIMAGTILGPFALFAYSFPLGLGQALVGNLMLTGIVCGCFCAALCRALIGPQISD
jgi:hypothetical protein